MGIFDMFLPPVLMGVFLPQDCLVASAPVLGVNRHRIETDGEGITTLVAFYGCPLHCKYCLNNDCHNAPSNYVSPSQLLEQVAVDDLYYRSTNGGITFGGGEPLLYPNFINEFASLCNGKWTINVETSLNVPIEDLVMCYDCISCFIVDLKCLSESKYFAYTGMSNDRVISNLQWLARSVSMDKIVVRVPDIPDYTDDADIDAAIQFIDSLGIKSIDRFSYVLPDDAEKVRGSRLHHGKRICEILKELRVEIARDNGLVYEPPVCTHDGPCMGTCPRCDAELRNISDYIHTLEKHNVEVRIGNTHSKTSDI